MDDGRDGLFIHAKLEDERISRKIIDQTIMKFGRIDGIVNDAGMNDGVGLQNDSPSAFRSSILANLSHYYDFLHFSVEQFIKNKGSIVNISSKIAVTDQGGTSGYTAIKGAQLALTREWAVELVSYEIRVNTIFPVEVMTPQYKKWISNFNDPTQEFDRIISKIPLEKRMTTSTEIAVMWMFLLSSKSSHITGQWQHIDGECVHLDRSIS